MRTDLHIALKVLLLTVGVAAVTLPMMVILGVAEAIALVEVNVAFEMMRSAERRLEGLKENKTTHFPGLELLE